MKIETIENPLLNLVCIVFLAFTLDIVMGCDVPADDTDTDDTPAADAAQQSECGEMECAEGQVCIENMCRPSHCADEMLSGDETMPDCGGACPACSADDAGMSLDFGAPDMGTADDAAVSTDSAPEPADGGMADASGSDMTMMSNTCAGGQVNTDEELARYDGCQTIEGQLILIDTPISDLSPLASVTEITGTLVLRDNESLVSLAPLSNVTTLGGLLLDSNGALVNLSGLSSLRNITEEGLEIAHGDQLRDISTLDSLASVAGQIAVHQNPVLCQVMVNHFVEQLVRRNPQLNRGETGSNGADEPTCGPLCAMQCADGGECYGDIYTEQNFCQETCRDIIDCTEVAFCREAEGCLPAGMPSGSTLRRVLCESMYIPGPCMGDGDCPGTTVNPWAIARMPRFLQERCGNNDDCVGQQFCVQGRCQDGCLVDADCGVDARCVGANAADAVPVNASLISLHLCRCTLIGDGTYGGGTSGPSVARGELRWCGER